MQRQRNDLSALNLTVHIRIMSCKYITDTKRFGWYVTAENQKYRRVKVKYESDAHEQYYAYDCTNTSNATKLYIIINPSPVQQQSRMKKKKNNKIKTTTQIRRVVRNVNRTFRIRLW